MTEDEQSAASPRNSSEQPLTIDAPEVSANSEPITVQVIGAAPGATVDLRATLEDADGDEFSSQATFTADGDGVVDLTEHAPDSGDWDDARPMAWIWAMNSDGDGPFANLAELDAINVTLNAETDAATAERTITRVLHDDEVGELQVDADGVVGTLYLPADDGPHPGVIELHGSGGRRSAGAAKLLASHGYATLALTYFGDDDAIPDELERVPVSYADDAADWLRDQPEVADGRVGVVGSSRGGEFALLISAYCDWVGAVVTFAGSGVPWDTPADVPAWTRDGDPVPHIEADEHPMNTNLDDRDLEPNVPPVETADGPILMLSGEADHIWDAARLCDVVVDRLDDHDYAYDYDHRVYEDCGHLIGTPYAPLAGIEEIAHETPDGTVHTGATALGTVRSGEDAWPAVFDTLEDGLKERES